MKFSLTPLSATLALALASQVAFADDKELPTAHLGTLQVTVSADASGAGLKKAYVGGQVATGARLGILGNQNTQDTPFSIVSYTNQFITDKQADSVGDVLQKDPAVRVARGYGNFQETYFIRGFLTNSDEAMFNGLYGVLPRQYIASELFERVELQRGSSSALNGASTGGGNIGGTISLLPKRAKNTPNRTVTLTSENAQNFKVSADVGQRFGANNEFGVRTNVALQTGGSAIDKEDKKLGLLAVGLDYRKSGVRLSADLGYQNNELDKARPSIYASTFVPEIKSTDSNWAKDGTYSDEKDVFGTLRGEYDINQHLTVYGAVGHLNGKERNSVQHLFTVNNANGDSTAWRFDNVRDNKISTGELGFKGFAQTGNISHNWVVSANTSKSRETGNWKMGGFANDNLYNPTNPDMSNLPWSGDTNNTYKAKSFAIADKMGLFDDKLSVLLAGRYQTLSTQTASETYKKSKFAPSIGVSYELLPEVSVYANYAENLNKGVYIVAQHGSKTVTNGNTSSDAYVSKQHEIGAKYDNGKLGGSVALFRTNKPNYIYRDNNDNTETFVKAGDDKHQGLELSIFGTPSQNTRLLGGATFLNAKQTNGKQVIGTPKFLANAGVEYDLAGVEGLTLTGDLTHTGARYADSANTLKVSGATVLDLGARYETQWAGKGVTLKGVINNVTDKKYYSSVGGYEGYGYLNVGEPRTIKVSATIDF